MWSGSLQTPSACPEVSVESLYRYVNTWACTPTAPTGSVITFHMMQELQMVSDTPKTFDPHVGRLKGRDLVTPVRASAMTNKNWCVNVPAHTIFCLFHCLPGSGRTEPIFRCVLNCLFPFLCDLHVPLWGFSWIAYQIKCLPSVGSALQLGSPCNIVVTFMRQGTGRESLSFLGPQLKWFKQHKCIVSQFQRS